MVLLCRYDHYWYLAHFSLDGQNMWSVSSGTRMPNHGGFVPVNMNLGRNMSSFDGITFYPKIRYKGMSVTPMMWKPDSKEPILKCLAGQSADDWPSDAGDEYLDMLRADGWHICRDDSWGYVHVDDLEKIEGSPPDGAF